ncbi:putative arsenite transmembrane transporter protein, partial [Aureobasidium melanogenum]
PIDIMVFFVTLAYIAISIDASGLIRFLAFKVLQKGGKVGHLLFFYLYAFFFSLGAFVGNDPIILSGTAFLAYMTRVSSNIDHPRAWMYSQFSIANIASAILVSSNPTNLVLAGAFQIKFIVYTANMIVPVVVTAIVLFPFLLYVVFASPQLIPLSIEMETLSDEAKSKKPVNPNIPQAKGKEPEDDEEESPENKELALAEIMNPFLDKGGATFGSVVMAVALITLLGINAASSAIGEHPVFWITLPAATIMFCWDVAYGWRHRKETREIAKRRQAEFSQAQEERANSERQTGGMFQTTGASSSFVHVVPPTPEVAGSEKSIHSVAEMSPNAGPAISPAEQDSTNDGSRNKEASRYESHETDFSHTEKLDSALDKAIDEENTQSYRDNTHDQPTSLVSFIAAKYRWLQETFPTVMAVLGHLPLKLVPFALSMFVLIQGLVTKGWVPVFAYGWDHWVSKTGTIGAIGGMGFLGVILCNFAGTNIGTTILLSRVIQAWQQIHINNGIPITDRTFWATVYAMALGVNYGAFSIAFSASLAGLLWRDILSRKHIHVRRLDFARENIPIIAVAMVVGCAVLNGLTWSSEPTTAIDLYNGEQYEQCVAHINTVFRDTTPNYARVRYYTPLAWCADGWYEAEDMRSSAEYACSNWCLFNRSGSYPGADRVQRNLRTQLDELAEYLKTFGPDDWKETQSFWNDVEAAEAQEEYAAKWTEAEEEKNDAATESEVEESAIAVEKEEDEYVTAAEGEEEYATASEGEEESNAAAATAKTKRPR